MSNLIINGILQNCNGQKSSVEVTTKAWESGVNDLPKELELTAKDRILFSLSAFSKQKKSLEDLNDALMEKGPLLVCAGSPPICWSPSNTIVKAREIIK